MTYPIAASRLSISLRSAAKSIGFVNKVSATFECFAFGLGIAIGRNHDDRNIRANSLCFWQELKSAHTGHVDVGQDQDQRCAGRVTDLLKRAGAGLGKVHVEAAGAEIPPELLAKQHLDIGFVIDNQNKDAHVCAPGLPAMGRRGRVTLNSVNSPGSVLTSIDPEC